MSMPNSWYPVADRLPSWLRGRRGLVVLAALVLSLGVAFNWGWLVAVGVAPLLLSVLPCVAMCAFGLCMNRIAGSPDKASSAARSETEPDNLSVAAPRSCCASGHRDATAAER